MTHEQFYKLTREQIEHEDQLLNHRTTWLLVLQGLLFSAYSLSITAEAVASNGGNLAEFQTRLDLVRQCLAVSGVVSSIMIAIGVLAASRSMHALVKRWEEKAYIQEQHNYPQIIGRETFGIVGGLIPVMTLPLLVFPVAWISLAPSAWIYTVAAIAYGIFFICFIIPIYAEFKKTR